MPLVKLDGKTIVNINKFTLVKAYNKHIDDCMWSYDPTEYGIIIYVQKETNNEYNTGEYNKYKMNCQQSFEIRNKRMKQLVDLIYHDTQKSNDVIELEDNTW